MAHTPAHYVKLRVDGVQLWVPKDVHADVKRLVKPYETEFGEPAAEASGVRLDSEESNKKIKAANRKVNALQKEVKELKAELAAIPRPTGDDVADSVVGE